MSKKLFVFSLIAVLVAGFVGPVAPAYAKEDRGDRMEAKVASRTAKMEDRKSANMERLRERADREIERRVAALNKLLERITAMKRLTDAQKTSFTTGIQSQINSLTALKAKIDADTDIETLRTDVKSIVSSYRIFALYMPQVSIMAHADRLLAVVDEMNTVSTKLRTRIDEVKAAGKDTAAMETLMTDRAAKLADATTQAQNAINAVVGLTPEGYPGNKSTLTSARTMLKTARQDLQKALQDVQEIRQLLRKAGVQTNAQLTPVPTQ